MISLVIVIAVLLSSTNCNGSKLTEGKYANMQSNLVYLGQAKRLQSVMTSLTRYRIFDHSPWQKHRNYFILRSEHLEQSNLMLQEYWISHSILRTRGMRKYIIFLVIQLVFLVLFTPAIYTTFQQPHVILMLCLMSLIRP